MGLDWETIPALLAMRVRATPGDTAFMEKGDDGRWRPVRWDAFEVAVRDLALRLQALGLATGDRAAILMPNGLQWERLQHAVYRLGGVVLGLDVNDPPARIDDIFSLCRPTMLFVDRLERLQQLSPEARRRLHWIVVQHEDGALPRLQTPLFFLDRLPASVADALPAQVDPDAVATILLTSGTTGRPKAFSYRHRQLAAAVKSIVSHFGELPAQAHTACWLPLANPFQRIINFCAMAMNWKAFMVSPPTTIMEAVPRIEPHVFAAVPRFYEKLMDGIQRRIDQMAAPQRALVQWGVRTGRRYRQTLARGERPTPLLRWLHRLADGLVLRRIRAVMGNRLRYGISGSAAMPLALSQAFEGLGWPVLEAYGISENIVPMAMNVPGAIRLGSVGRPLAENTIRLAPDGEILVKGIGVSAEATPVTRDGFLKTGDLGRLDADGYLWLTGRKADLFKLSTGRKVTPAAIEAALETIEEVDFAVAAGADRRYVTALLNLTSERWQRLQQTHNGPQGAFAHLRHLARQACAHLPAYCRPVDIAVVQQPFTHQTGELTNNMKLRRTFVLEKYAGVLEPLYRRRGDTPAMTAGLRSDPSAGTTRMPGIPSGQRPGKVGDQ